MTDDRKPDRPGQVALDDAVCEAIRRALREWDVTYYDVVGVLHMVADRYSHVVIEHEGEE
jgi:hypothetical protein